MLDISTYINLCDYVWLCGVLHVQVVVVSGEL